MMSIRKASVEEKLKELPLKRLRQLAVDKGQRPKRYKDKATVVGEITTHATKQSLVKRLTETGGVSVEQICEMFDIDQQYARDIISKLRKKGMEFRRDSYGKYHAV
jgi:predicted HTH transcriptional regulator